MSNLLSRDQRFKSALFDTTPVSDTTVPTRTIDGRPCVWHSNVLRSQLPRFMATTRERNLITDRPQATATMTEQQLIDKDYLGVWQLHER